jgi:hypothetical protein
MDVNLRKVYYGSTDIPVCGLDSEKTVAQTFLSVDWTVKKR